MGCKSASDLAGMVTNMERTGTPIAARAEDHVIWKSAGDAFGVADRQYHTQRAASILMVMFARMGDTQSTRDAMNAFSLHSWERV